MRSFLIAITLIVAVGATYCFGKRLLSKREGGGTRRSLPPREKEGEEHQQPPRVEPVHDPIEEIPIEEQVSPKHESEPFVSGNYTSGLSTTPGDTAEHIKTEAIFLVSQPIEQDPLNEEHQGPDPASLEETIQGQPVITEQTPEESQEFAAESASKADGPPESPPPTQAENFPPVIVEPLPETEGEGNGALVAVSLEMEELEPGDLDTGSVRTEPDAAEPVETELNEGVDTEEDGEIESGGFVPDDEVTEEGGIALATRAKRPRVPRKFRPTGRTPAQTGTGGKTQARSVEPGGRDRALPIEVRVVIERGGYCRVSMLPRRNDGLPEAVLASGTGNPDELVALQEEWYQDIAHPELGMLLRQGVEWEATDEEGQRIRWSLSGRDLFVLSRSDSLSGFISTSRLVLGEEHFVLCTDGILPEVQEAILLTGCPPPTMLGVSDGIPAGWAGLKGVTPRIAVTPRPEGHFLDALRPLAEVEIIITGGIRIGRTAWLVGFPPSIRLRGDTSAVDEVLIDGERASIAGNGIYTSTGWDIPGEHNVWCTVGAKTYRIHEGAEDWPAWDAYSWSLGETGGEDGGLHSAICGALVLPAKVLRGRSFSVLIPESNCVLLGAAPGEIYTCITRRGLTTPYCTGDPPFQPVWALPADSLGCDREAVRILRVGEALHPTPVSQSPAKKQRTRMRSWASTVLNACRKGLRTEPSDPIAAALWRDYKRQAHVIRRRLR